MSGSLGASKMIAMATGDLLNLLKTGVEKAIDFIRDAATSFGELIINFAGKVYQAVLNTMEAVAGALE